MWWRIGKTVLKIYAVLWLAAAGGFLGANLAGVLGNFLSAQENSAAGVPPWTHVGWYAGTVLFFIGAITGQLRFINGASQSEGQKPPDQPVSDDQSTETATSEDSSRQGKRTGVLSGALSFGFIGGLLGAIVGCSLLIFWFSLACSPFAPQSATATVEVRQERDSGSARPQNVHRSSHPVAVYLCVIPAVLGAAAGVLSGGIGAAFGKVHDL